MVRLEAALSELKSMRETVLEYAKQNKNKEAANYIELNNIPVIKKAQAELNTSIQTANT